MDKLKNFNFKNLLLEEFSFFGLIEVEKLVYRSV